MIASRPVLRLSGRGGAQYLVPDAHGDTPMRHGAIRLERGDCREFLQCLPVPERMQGCERCIEARLNFLAARDGKADSPATPFHQVVAGSDCARRN